MRKNLFALTFVLLTFGLLVQAPFVAAGQYDTPEKRSSILVDKMVGLPTNTSGDQTNYVYVDNATSDNHRFGPLEYVYFKISVKNTGNQRLENVVLKDYEPEFLDLIPETGSLVSEIQTINVGTLEPDQQVTYTLKARVSDASRLPAEGGVFCRTNKTWAGNNDVSDEDMSQFCIQKSTPSVVTVPAPEKIPSTGNPFGMLTILGGAVALMAGRKLQKSV